MSKVLHWRKQIGLNGQGLQDRLRRRFGTLYDNFRSNCPFCSVNYKKPEKGPRWYRCPQCGFRWAFDVSDGSGVGGPWRQEVFTIKILEALDINDSRLGMTELGEHLAKKFGDVYELSPRRFEELVADVYKHLGYQVRLTKATRDGGFDLVLLEKTSGTQVLVECKRHKNSRKVGVGTVRQLLGVQTIEDVNLSKIVTSSGFSADAKKLAERVSRGALSYSMELVDSELLLEALRVYKDFEDPLDLPYSASL